MLPPDVRLVQSLAPPANCPFRLLINRAWMESHFAEADVLLAMGVQLLPRDMSATLMLDANTAVSGTETSSNACCKRPSRSLLCPRIMLVSQVVLLELGDLIDEPAEQRQAHLEILLQHQSAEKQAHTKSMLCYRSESSCTCEPVVCV